MSSLFGMNAVELTGNDPSPSASNPTATSSPGSTAVTPDEIMSFYPTTFKRQVLVMCKPPPPETPSRPRATLTAHASHRLFRRCPARHHPRLQSLHPRVYPRHLQLPDHQVHHLSRLLQSLAEKRARKQKSPRPWTRKCQQDEEECERRVGETEAEEGRDP